MKETGVMEEGDRNSETGILCGCLLDFWNCVAAFILRRLHATRCRSCKCLYRGRAYVVSLEMVRVAFDGPRFSMATITSAGVN